MLLCTSCKKARESGYDKKNIKQAMRDIIQEEYGKSKQLDADMILNCQLMMIAKIPEDNNALKEIAVLLCGFINAEQSSREG